MNNNPNRVPKFLEGKITPEYFNPKDQCLDFSKIRPLYDMIAMSKYAKKINKDIYDFTVEDAKPFLIAE